MINILIVDDDSVKIGDVVKIIVEFSEIPSSNVQYALGIKEALVKLQSMQYDLVILDMQLPNNIGSATIPNGGIALLEAINATDRIKKPTHIIGLTSYDESFSDYERAFVEQVWALIKFNKQFDNWKEQIKNKVKYLIEWKKQLMVEMLYNTNNNYDIAIITAVEQEYKSIMNLEVDWRPLPVINDTSQYKEGLINTMNKVYKVVVAKQHQMGMPAASVLTMKLIHNFRPKYLCMVGIAAGKRGKVELGDILVSAESWDYGSGKIREENEKDNNYIFEPEPHQISIDLGLKELFLSDFKEVLYDIRQRWNRTASKVVNVDLSIHVGPVASGASVIQDEDIVKSFIDPHNRKLIGLDMETYGVYYAATNCSFPRPTFFSIKSVCDFADKVKNDDFQAYAAYTSSQFLFYFIKNYL